MPDNKGSAVDLGLVTPCPNHRDRPGTVRCDSCLRPVCEECLVRVDNNKYCSEKCKAGAQATRERVDDLASRPAPAKQVPVVGLIVLGALIIGGIYAWQHKVALIAWFHKHVF